MANVKIITLFKIIPWCFCATLIWPALLLASPSSFKSESQDKISLCPDDLLISDSNNKKSFRSQCHLTLFWSLEYIGADLAKAFLSSRSHFQPAGIGIVDSGSFPENLNKKLTERTYFAADSIHRSLFSPEHSKLVTNLVFHPLFGSAALAELGAFVAFEGDPLLNATTKKLMGSTTRVINFSVELPNLPVLNENIQLLLDNNKTLVVASGNKYPRRFDQHLTDQRLFIVGAIDPTGLVSPYSVQSADVDILAPAGFDIVSTKDGVKYTLFNGTSAAAPLVTGVMGDLLTMLPELSLGDQDRLVKSTSTPLLSNATNANGAGLINAYKLVRCATRLKREFSQHSPLSIKKIQKVCDFSREARRLKAQSFVKLKAKTLKAMSEQEQSALLNNLRRSLFLDFEKETALILAQSYKTLGYTTNALFYENLTLSPSAVFTRNTRSPSPFFNYAFRNEGPRSGSLHGALFQYASRFPKDSKIYLQAQQTIRTLATKGTTKDLRSALVYSYLLGDDGKKWLAHVPSTQDSENLWLDSFLIEADISSSTGYQWDKIVHTFTFATSPIKKVRTQFYQTIPFHLMEYSNAHIELQYQNSKASELFEAQVQLLRSLIAKEPDPELQKMAEQKMEDAMLN